LCPRNGIYIIDLNRTIENLDRFVDRVKSEVQKGGKVLFVGTKSRSRTAFARSDAGRNALCRRAVLGGMLTNFQTIRQSIARLEKIEKMEADARLRVDKKRSPDAHEKEGKTPSVLTAYVPCAGFPRSCSCRCDQEAIAIEEARRLRIPIGAIVAPIVIRTKLTILSRATTTRSSPCSLSPKSSPMPSRLRARHRRLKKWKKPKRRDRPCLRSRRTERASLQTWKISHCRRGIIEEEEKPQVRRRVVRKKIVRVSDDD